MAGLDTRWLYIPRRDLDYVPRFNDASLDHIFFGDVSAWLVNDIVGIKKDDLAPGFGHIIIDPHFVEGLDWAKASHKSVRGLIRASWKKEESRC